MDLTALDQNQLRQVVRESAAELIRRQRGEQQPLVWYLPPVDSRSVLQASRERTGCIEITLNHATKLARLHPADVVGLLAWLVVNDPGGVFGRG